MDRSKPGDRDLGMDRSISRRDFLAGVAVGVGAAACGLPETRRRFGFASLPTGDAAVYPPAKTGLRGSHPGSFEVAHQLVREGRGNWEPVYESEDSEYDLVVVGAGVSGLAAAYFYRARNPRARILILENHDDFGGHARRNEFEHRGRTILGYGGSQSLESPREYSAVAKQLLVELGVVTRRFYEAYDQDFDRDHGLGNAIYFDRESYGADRLLALNSLSWANVPSIESLAAAAKQMPISADARSEFIRLYSPDASELPDLSDDQKRDLRFLMRVSYREFLRDHLGIASVDLLKILNALTSTDTGLGVDGISAWEGISYTGLPGLRPESRERLLYETGGDSDEPYIFHFPDGNASIARLLVRNLIPRVARGGTMEDVVTAKFHYDRLDERAADVRLRLASTVVRVGHDGAPATADSVVVTYVRAGRSERVAAKACVLACYNRVIPHLCPELPSAQREALGNPVKVPLVYTNVLLRNWAPWKKAGLGYAICPGSYPQKAMLAFPVSLGDYGFASGPEEPIVAHLERAPIQPFSGRTPREQFKAGRFEMLQTSFETIERSIRNQLGGMLGHAGLDPARDIEAITVNRWPHGYTYQFSPHVDPEYADDEWPYVVGRQPFGRVTIANADAGGAAYLDSAIDQAHRAVTELPS